MNLFQENDFEENLMNTIEEIKKKLEIYLRIDLEKVERRYEEIRLKEEMRT